MNLLCKGYYRILLSVAALWLMLVTPGFAAMVTLYGNQHESHFDLSYDPDDLALNDYMYSLDFQNNKISIIANPLDTSNFQDVVNAIDRHVNLVLTPRSGADWVESVHIEKNGQYSGLFSPQFDSFVDAGGTLKMNPAGDANDNHAVNRFFETTLDTDEPGVWRADAFLSKNLYTGNPGTAVELLVTNWLLFVHDPEQTVDLPFINDAGMHINVVLAPIPLPATIPLFISGLLVLGMLFRFNQPRID